VKYLLEFYPEAAKELNRLDPSVRAEVIKRISDRLENPHVSASALRGDLKNFYKIKLESRGLRIVYRVEDEIVTVFVVAVGKRDKKKVYTEASLRSRKKRRLL
jgi:mRNA interferase RelE/StbE